MVKRFIRESASADVDRWMREERAASSRLTSVEVASALARRRRAGELTDAGVTRLFAELDTVVRRLLVVEVTSSIAARARDLLVEHPLRAADAVQLASALDLQDELGRRIEFVCFDERLAAAARAEGLALLGP